SLLTFLDYIPLYPGNRWRSLNRSFKDTIEEMNFDTEIFDIGSADLLGFGEPTHLEPAFAWTRNELFAELAGRGFRSIALESDRVAALVVDDYVRQGAGTLDEAMRAGFSHGFGELEANRQLVAWMREYNENRSAEDRLAFHGFDGSMET